MKNEEIIEMADECGLAGYFELDGDSVGQLMVTAFAKLVAEKEREIWARRVVRLQNLMDLREQQPNKPCCIAEREACAKLLETTDLGGLKDNPEMQSWVAEILLAYVKAIRARGQA